MSASEGEHANGMLWNITHPFLSSTAWNHPKGTEDGTRERMPERKKKKRIVLRWTKSINIQSKWLMISALEMNHHISPKERVSRKKWFNQGPHFHFLSSHVHKHCSHILFRIKWYYKWDLVWHWNLFNLAREIPVDPTNMQVSRTAAHTGTQIFPSEPRIYLISRANSKIIYFTFNFCSQDKQMFHATKEKYPQTYREDLLEVVVAWIYLIYHSSVLEIQHRLWFNFGEPLNRGGLNYVDWLWWWCWADDHLV